MALGAFVTAGMGALQVVEVGLRKPGGPKTPWPALVLLVQPLCHNVPTPCDQEAINVPLPGRRSGALKWPVLAVQIDRAICDQSQGHGGIDFIDRMPAHAPTQT